MSKLDQPAHALACAVALTPAAIFPTSLPSPGLVSVSAWCGKSLRKAIPSLPPASFVPSIAGAIFSPGPLPAF